MEEWRMDECFPPEIETNPWTTDVVETDVHGPQVDYDH